MKYSKPQIVAQNAKTGSFAAGCPANLNGGTVWCRNCDRAQ